MPAIENLSFLLQGPVVPEEEGGGCGGGSHRSCGSQTIAVLFRGNDSVSRETLKDAFNFFLFLPFKTPFYFIIIIILPRRNRERKKKTNKAITKC